VIVVWRICLLVLAQLLPVPEPMPSYVTVVSPFAVRMAVAMVAVAVVVMCEYSAQA
jgi:hypothetical protein